MGTAELREGVDWVGAIDWDRREFDALVPIPAGTTYNAFLVRGKEKTALIDAVDAQFTETLLRNLTSLGVDKIDYIVCNHAEQDHSGALPVLLERFPAAKILATDTARDLLLSLLHLPEERLETVKDGARIDLGERTLRFLHFPWAHWPDTMVTYLEEDRLLFSCDLFGSHLACMPVRPVSQSQWFLESLRYYACILMPYREILGRNLALLSPLALDLVAPSHGPVLPDPAQILATYQDWVHAEPKNLVVIPYISMHDSTRQLAHYLAEALERRGVEVELFHLGDGDLGRLAMAVVDAATVVIASPTVLGGAHPKAAYAAYLVNALRPKIKYLSLIGSYGWGGGVAEQLVGLMPDLNAELIEPVVVRGRGGDDDLGALNRLADEIARRHEALGAPPIEGEQGAESTTTLTAEQLAEARTKKYKCSKCRWVYDPERGDPQHGIAPGTPFEDIPEDKWHCPLCGAGKRRFRSADR